MAAIDSKKLLPSGSPGGAITETQKPFLVPVSNILYKKDVNISQKLLKPADKETQGPGGSLLVIKKKVLKIEDVIGSTYLIQQSENNRKRKEKERQKTEEREKKLETKPGGKVDFGNLPKVSLPGGSILDTIKRFIAFTFAGFLFDKYNQYLPKLLEFGKYIAPVTKFIDAFSKNVVDGVIKFIDLGYQTYDNVRKKIDAIGGKDAAKQFDKFSGELNKLLNGAIMASMLIASTAPRTPGGAAGGTGAGASRSLGMGMTPKPISGFGAGTAMTPGRYRAPGQASARGFGLEQARKGLTFEQSVAARKAAQSTASQGAKGAARLGIARVPIIGALIGFIVDTVVFREKPSRAAAGAVGSAVGQGIGLALAGGTTFGLGAGVGLFVGGFLGDIVGKSLYDAFAGYQPQPTPAKAQGGQVGSGQSRVSPTRKIKTKKTTSRKTYIPSKVQPGRDVGGKLRIEGLYGKDEPGQRSALRALVKSSSDLKKMRSLNGVAGGMLGAGVDMALGQKPDRKLANSLGNMFGSVVEAAINAELNSSFNDISKSIAMANGGVVPSREIGSGMNIGEKIGRYISNAFSIALESSAAKVLQNLNQELNLEGGSTGGVSPAEGGDFSGDAGDFSGETSAIKAFNYFKSQGYTAFQAAAIVGNLLQENRAMNPTLANSIGRKGIAQWDKNRWSRLESFASKNGLNPNTLEAQLQFIHHEIKTGGGGMSMQSFKATKNLEEATILFRKKYERPGEEEANDAQRIKYATSVLQASTGGPSLSAKGVKKFTRSDITSFFKQQESFRSKPHEGMDIAAPQGTPISFGMGGKVIGVWRTNSGAREANGGYGTYMDVRFSDGRIARIAHLSSVPASLRKGSIFGANQVIAYSGGEEGKPGSGRSGGPHIHLEQLSKPMGAEETTKGKYDPLKGGLFNLIQRGGTKVSVAPVQPSRDIASLQTDTSYTVVHDVNNIVMPVMVG